MTCPFCKDQSDLPLLEDQIVDHLIVCKSLDGHIHVHGPIDNQTLMGEFILAIATEAKIEAEIE